MIDEFQNLFPCIAFILLRGIIFLGDFRCNANSVIFSSKLVTRKIKRNKFANGLISVCNTYLFVSKYLKSVWVKLMQGNGYKTCKNVRFRCVFFSAF